LSGKTNKDKLMRKFYNRLFKKTKLKSYIFLKKIISNRNKNYSRNEIKSSAIFRKLINHPDSTFLIAPLSEKRYIKNEKLGIFILLNGLRLNITNHIYNYDIDICEGLFDKLSSIFDEKVEKIRLKFEIEMQGQIQHSLSKILDKVTNESSL
jgi:hypothetical protein